MLSTYTDLEASLRGGQVSGMYLDFGDANAN